MASAVAAGRRVTGSYRTDGRASGIKADAPKPPGRVVAKKIGDEAMRSFMKGNGDNHWDGPDRCQINGVSAHHFDSCSLMRSRAAARWLPHASRLRALDAWSASFRPTFGRFLY